MLSRFKPDDFSLRTRKRAKTPSRSDLGELSKEVRNKKQYIRNFFRNVTSIRFERIEVIV